MAKLLVGCSSADITPSPGAPLSGFIARENKPSLSVDDPLNVRVLVLSQDGANHFLVSYELLGISAALEKQILSALEESLGDRFDRQRCVLTAVHTHSAPTVSALEGESDADPAYIQMVCERTALASRQALSQLAPASLFTASVQVPGLTYNRRALMPDGQVSMAVEPGDEVLERGPVDDMLTVLAWRGETGKTLAILVHFACHGVALCTPAIGGDIPGEIARRVGALFHAPCIFLQGATGDINPICVTTNRTAMLAWCDQWMAYFTGVPEKLSPVPCLPFKIASTELALEFQPLPPREVVLDHVQGFERIIGGDLDSAQVQPTLRLIADFLNTKPGERPDVARMVYTIQAVANSEKRVLSVIDAGHPLLPCPLKITAWRLGTVVLFFIGAEVFAETGLKIRELDKNRVLLPISYAAPVVGYIPDRGAVEKGGYEVDYAWRFYRQPASFAPDSEEHVVETVQLLLDSII